MLKEFAVFAFCAEIARLPSQISRVTSALFLVPSSDVTTAQTTPLPSTSVSHMGKPNPPFGAVAEEFAGTTCRSTDFKTEELSPRPLGPVS